MNHLNQHCGMIWGSICRMKCIDEIRTAPARCKNAYCNCLYSCIAPLAQLLINFLSQAHFEICPIVISQVAGTVHMQSKGKLSIPATYQQIEMKNLKVTYSPGPCQIYGTAVLQPKYCNHPAATGPIPYPGRMHFMDKHVLIAKREYLVRGVKHRAD
jgi:hypothetical protein